MADKYLFLLGNTPILSKTELYSFLISNKHTFTLLKETNTLVEINFTTVFDPHQAMNILGGVTKIAKIVKEGINYQDLSLQAVELLQNKNKKIVFGISELNNALSHQQLQSLKNDTKKALQNLNKDVRYVNSEKDQQVSNVVITKQKAQELIILGQNSVFTIAQTLVVQDYQYWSKADYQRPYADAKSGMLPPKVARMMINLSKNAGPVGQQSFLLDPFCGMGTILQEGLRIGFEVWGSDISTTVLEKTQKNLEWYKKEFNPKNNFTLLNSDAAHISNNLANMQFEAIVTEGYMGPTLEIYNQDVYTSGRQVKLSTQKIKNIYKGLEKMYLGGLRDWKKILKKNARIVIIFPSLHLPGFSLTPSKIIDKISSIGYSITIGPLVYGKPGAVVKRNIYLLINSE